MRQDKKPIQPQLAKKKKPTAIRNLKIAIIHDSYLYRGGAERVLDSFLQLFPKAHVYIPLIKPKYLNLLSQSHAVFTSAYNILPLPEQFASILKPFIFQYWQSLDLSSYDLVISSSHSFSSKAVITQPKTLHISYVHTPPRYLYQEFNEMTWLRKPFFQRIFSGLLTYLRKKDYEAAQQPDLMLANSQTTQARVKKYYGRNSTVLFPPVRLPANAKKKRVGKPKYYLFHSRLVRQKGAELVIRTFNKIRKPLVIVGTGPEEKFLRKIAGTSISFAGFVSDAQLAKLYGKAKALIYAAIEEDFGMIPVEAMGHGVPVIAFDSGGVRETIIPGRTGLLFHKYSLESLEKALSVFEKKKWSAEYCRKQAKKFSEVIFQKKLLKIIHSQLKKRTHI